MDDTDELIREDVLAWIRKERKAAAKAKRMADRQAADAAQDKLV